VYMGIRLRVAAILICAMTCGALAAAQVNHDKLRVYFVDEDGGQATLFVTPDGESLLIDTGWPGQNGIPADRIVAAAKEAGISKIDYVLITHYHADHAGGIPQLLARIPVGTFIDHGPNSEHDNDITDKDYAEYQAALASGKYRVLEPKPGEVLPIKGLTATVISSDGRLIDQPVPGGGGKNGYCVDTDTLPPDKTENSHSLGIEIKFGKLTLLDLGDLTKDKEVQLMCPVNKLGHVDVYIVSHHGWDQSTSRALVDAIHARVAIMDNGAKKGGSTPVLKAIKAAPGLETLWQLHYSEEGGEENNTDASYIANLQGPDAAHELQLVGSKDGSFEVTNTRTGFSKHYAAK
jgi:beta-lactamase superfamily II metal-dependent hydrolase